MSYVGCSHCTAVFPRGNGGPCFGISRKYLPPTHDLRNRTCGLYQYTTRELSGKSHDNPYPVAKMCHCHINLGPYDNPDPIANYIYHCHINLGPPKRKDTAFVYTAARRALHGGFDHYLGQKGFPMFSNLRYYSYESMNIVDWMHNCAGLYKWIMKVIVGPLGDKKKGSAVQRRAAADRLHRQQLKKNNIFPDLWEDAPLYLDTSKAALLRRLVFNGDGDLGEDHHHYHHQ